MTPRRTGEDALPPEGFPLERCAWSEGTLDEALETLARAVGLPTRPAAAAAAGGAGAPRAQDFDREVDRAAARLDVDVELVRRPFAEVEQLVARATPGLVSLRVEVAGAPATVYLVVLRRRGERVDLIKPNHRVQRVAFAQVCDAACAFLTAERGDQAQRVLDAAGLRGAARARTHQALLRHHLGVKELASAWRLRAAPGSPFLGQLWHLGLPRRAAAMLAINLAQAALGLLGAWLLGRSTFTGRMDAALVLAWALLGVTGIPLQLGAQWLASGLALDVAEQLRRRLFVGALRLDPDVTRLDGSGQTLGRVMEARAVEALALGTGFGALSAAQGLATAAFVLQQGTGGLTHVALLGAWVALLALLAGRYVRQYQRWTGTRLGLIEDLIEKMTGHRTRAAQQPPERWHLGEDAALAGYLTEARAMDRLTIGLSALLPQSWTLVAIAALVPGFVGGALPPARLAVALGGITLATGAISTLVSGLGSLVGAWVGWRRVAPIFAAAAHAPRAGIPQLVHLAPPPAGGPAGAPPPARTPLLQVRDVHFRYASRGAPALRGVSLAIHAGERVLLEGASGGGKSTLGALLGGLRVPESGLVLLDGLDLASLGLDGWRRRLAVVPQFHENRIFDNTLAFNLLMGRMWPAAPEDLVAAGGVCQALGLGDLLARMPMGLQQSVGETGWRLSHGERSRVFIARALLQDARVVILDESLGALDPETHQTVLKGVLERVETVILIAHP